MIQGRKNSKLIEGPVKTQEKNFSSKITTGNKLVENAKPTPPHSAKSKISTTSGKKIIPSPARDGPRSARSVKTDSTTGEKKIGDRSTISEKGFGPPLKKTDQEQNVEATANSIPRIRSVGSASKYSSDYYQKFLGLRKPVKGAATEKTSVKNFVSTPKLENKQNVINKKCNFQMKTNLGRVVGFKKPSNFTPAAKVGAEKMTPKSSNLKKISDPPKLDKNRTGDVENSHGKAVSLNLKLGNQSSISRRANSKETTEKTGHILSQKSREVKRMKSEGDSLLHKSTPSSARRMETGPRSATSEIKDLNLNNKHKENPNFTQKINCKESGIKSIIKKENAIPKSVVPKSVLKNEILHVNMMTDTKLGANVKEKEEKVIPKEEEEEEEHPSEKLPPLDNSAIRPTETFDSFDSLEKANDGELLSLDHMIWNDLEKMIKETCDKTDIYDSGDDSGESLSDIISNLSLDEKKKHSESSEKEKSAGVNIQGKQIPEPNQVHVEKVAPVIVKPEKRSTEHEASSNIQEPPNETKDSSVEIESGAEVEKSKVKDSWFKDQSQILHEEKFEELTSGCISREVPSSPTGFFRTHKKLGFIGKVEDEECVSFDVGQVKLYQPYEGQMLFYDVANCIATQAYLKMCGLNYELEVRKNAEHMSPSGKVPFLSSCLCIIPEFEGIISFMQFKKFACFRIDENEKSSFRSMIFLLKNSLESAERYICWYDEETLMNYTKPRIGGMFPFPLNHILYWLKGHEERRNLKDEGRREMTCDMILMEINSCFRVLSQHLGDNSFFFGNISTEIDALVYGHIYAFVTAEKEGIFKDLHLIIKQFPNLITFAINFDKRFLLNKFPPVDSF